MPRIDLLSPIKRGQELPYSEFAYQIRDVIYLPVPEILRGIAFLDVIEARRSRRDFAPLSIKDLSTILWFTAKTFSSKHEESGYNWQHRPTPSAGGRHPIDILITNQNPGRDAFYLYDPLAHALCELEVHDEEAGEELLCEIETALPIGGATIICFVAQFERTLSKYDHGESLVWRDSGALLALVCLVAEALQLSCCGFGITGEPWISRMFGAGNLLSGVGGCLCGNRKTS